MKKYLIKDLQKGQVAITKEQLLEITQGGSGGGSGGGIPDIVSKVLEVSVYDLGIYSGNPSIDDIRLDLFSYIQQQQSQFQQGQVTYILVNCEPQYGEYKRLFILNGIGTTNFEDLTTPDIKEIATVGGYTLWESISGNQSSVVMDEFSDGWFKGFHGYDPPVSLGLGGATGVAVNEDGSKAVVFTREFDGGCQLYSSSDKFKTVQQERVLAGFIDNTVSLKVAGGWMFWRGGSLHTCNNDFGNWVDIELVGLDSYPDYMNINFRGGLYILFTSKGVFTSSDGITFTERLNLVDSLKVFCNDPSDYFYISKSQIIYRSLDGITWDQYLDIPTEFPGSGVVRSINYGNDTLVIHGYSKGSKGSPSIYSTIVRYKDEAWVKLAKGFTAESTVGFFLKGIFYAGYYASRDGKNWVLSSKQITGHPKGITQFFGTRMLEYPTGEVITYEFGANTDNTPMYLYNDFRGGQIFENYIEEVKVNGTVVQADVKTKTLDITTGDTFTLEERKTGGKWIDGKDIYTKVKPTADADPVDIETKFPDVIIGTYTVLKYTKTAE